MPSCALGGSTDWDVAALLSPTDNPVVCYDNDDSGKKATLGLANYAHRAIRCITTPGQDSDLDQYLRDLAPSQVYPALKTVWERVGPALRNISSVRDQLDTLRANEKDPVTDKPPFSRTS